MESNDPGEKFLDSQKPGINFKKVFFRIIARWPVILTFLVISVTVGYLINYYTTLIYLIKARITTNKYSEKRSSIVPGLIGASFFLRGLSDVYEEIPILKSPTRIVAAINKFDFRIKYISQGRIKSVLMDRSSFFDVKIDTILNESYPHSIPIMVKPVSAQGFILKIKDDRWENIIDDKIFYFDKPVQLGGIRLQISSRLGNKFIQEDKYGFIINRNSDLLNEYSRKLSISWTMKGSAMLDLSIESESPERDLKFMNAYYQAVDEIGLVEKNETLDKTIEFIDTQMRMVADSLNYYQRKAEGTRFERKEYSLGPEFVYKELNALDDKKAGLLLNERYLDYLTNYFRTKSNSEVFAPSIIGLDIPLLDNFVRQYINRKLVEKLYRNEDNTQNPLVNRADSLRRRLEKAIYESIKSTRQVNRESFDDIDRKIALWYASTGDIQNGCQRFSGYQRMYQLNLSLFDLLLRRKTEAAISKASAASDYKIIDAPSYSQTPIRPDKANNLLIAAGIGLFLPIGIFLYKDLTNQMIMDKEDLLAHLNMPMLGNVAHSIYPSRFVVSMHPRSVVAESFRSVRANLKFLAGNNNQKARTFLITSSMSGEGKSFCSINLAETLAASQNKTILIAADLRKPQIDKYLERSFNVKGLSEYLAGLASIEEIIITLDNSQFFLINSVKVPPNPSELLANERMKELMDYLKQRYDYIIIDTPPIGLVSDAMELFQYSDFNILIVRQKVTHKAALDMVNELYMEGKLTKFTVLFNDIELVRNRSSYFAGYVYGLGYSGYGYGYYEEDNSKVKSQREWWRGTPKS